MPTGRGHAAQRTTGLAGRDPGAGRARPVAVAARALRCSAVERSGRRRLFAAAALGLGVLAALALCEAALRLAPPERLDRIRYPCIYTPDPVLGYRYVPGASGRVAGHFEIDNPVRMNSLGFYDDEPLPADEARPRVLALGDSFTAAMNVPRDATWTAVLERELRRRGLPRADVVNLGLDGTGTDVHLELARRHLPRLGADVIVLAFFANDVGDVIRGRVYRECYRGYVLSYPTEAQGAELRARVDAHLARPLRRWIHDASYLVRLLVGSFAGRASPYRMEFLQAPSGPEPERRELRAGLARYRAAVEELGDLGERCACRVVVAPVPPRSDAFGSERIWRRRAPSAPLELLDVRHRIERMRRDDGRAHADLYFRYDAHLNAYGNELFGRAVADALALPKS